MAVDTGLTQFTASSPNGLAREWRLVKFGEAVRNVNVQERNPLERGIDRYLGLDHLDPGSLHVKRWGMVSEGTTFTRKFVKGQVLFAKRRAYQHKVAVAEFDGVCSGDILVFEANSNILVPELLPFIVESDGFFDHALQTSAGSLSPRTRWKDLARYEFPLPPKEEQGRIADILWAANEAVEKYRGSIVAAQSVHSSYIRNYLRDSTFPTTTLALSGTWLSGGTPDRTNRSFWVGGFPWVSPKDMKTDLINCTIETISELAANEHSKIAPAQSILMVVRGMILAHTFPVAMIGRPVAFNQDIKALIPANEFRPKFLFEWLKSQSTRCLALVSNSSHGTKRITTDLLSSLEVPQPTLAEQDQILTAIDAIESSEDGLHAHLVYLQELRHSLINELLAM